MKQIQTNHTQMGGSHSNRWGRIKNIKWMIVDLNQKGNPRWKKLHGQKMDWMFESSPNLYIEASPQCDEIRRWRLGTVIRSCRWSLHDGIVALLLKKKKSRRQGISSSALHCVRTQEENHYLRTRRNSLPKCQVHLHLHPGLLTLKNCEK